MMKCEICQIPISQERLEILPETKRCVEHSQTRKRVGFMVFGHKTAPDICLIDSNDEEGLRRAKRANRRAR